MAEIRVNPGMDGPAVTPPPRMTGAHTGPAAAEPSLGDLFRQLAQDSSTLIRQEITLAKTELSQSVSKATTDAVMIAVWGAVALVGSLVLVTFLVLLLGDILDNYWLSALIVGGLFTLAGGLLAKSYAKKLKNIDYKPEATIQTLKQDKAWVQSEVQSLKRDLTA